MLKRLGVLASIRVRLPPIHQAYLWTTIVQLTVVFNLSRAPWSSAAFWKVKQESMTHMLRRGLDNEMFMELWKPSFGHLVNENKCASFIVVNSAVRCKLRLHIGFVGAVPSGLPRT